jgi:hypothetical protein
MWNDLNIDLLLYCRLSRCYFTRRLDRTSLPVPADSLFKSIEELFAYFVFLSKQTPPILNKLLHFSEGSLTVEIVICSGAKRIKTVLELNQADLVDSVKLLKMRVQHMANQLLLDQKLCENEYEKDNTITNIRRELKEKCRAIRNS